MVGEVEGLNGHGTAVCTLDSDALFAAISSQQPDGSGSFLQQIAVLDEAFSRITVTAEPCENLSNGDEVVLTAAVRDSLLAEMGYYAETTEKTYTVSGRGEPFTTADKLSAADKTRLEELALAKAKAEAEDWYSYIKLTAATCTGIYGYDGRVWDSWNGLDSYGGVVALASCDFGADGEYPMAVFFQNCGKDGNGTLSFSEEDIVTMSKKIATTDVLSWLKSTFPEAVFTELGQDQEDKTLATDTANVLSFAYTFALFDPIFCNHLCNQQSIFVFFLLQFCYLFKTLKSL